MDTVPVLDHRALTRLRLVKPSESRERVSPPLQSTVNRFSETAIYALRTMRTALLLGNFAEAGKTARELSLFAAEMGTLRVKQICELLQDVGPGERAFFASRLLSSLEVEIRCAVAALSSHVDREAPSSA